MSFVQSGTDRVLDAQIVTANGQPIPVEIGAQVVDQTAAVAVFDAGGSGATILSPDLSGLVTVTTATHCFKWSVGTVNDYRRLEALLVPESATLALDQSFFTLAKALIYIGENDDAVAEAAFEAYYGSTDTPISPVVASGLIYAINADAAIDHVYAIVTAPPGVAGVDIGFTLHLTAKETWSA